LPLVNATASAIGHSAPIILPIKNTSSVPSGAVTTNVTLTLSYVGGSLANTVTLNVLVTGSCPSALKVAVKLTTVSASCLTTTPVAEITAGLSEAHSTVTPSNPSTLVGRVKLDLTVTYVSP
jgi:hypothetical protein